MTKPAKTTIAQDMATALLEDFATPEVVNDNDALITQLRSINFDYELGWTCKIIADNMDEARRLFLNEMERLKADDGVVDLDEYASERFGHTQHGIKL